MCSSTWLMPVWPGGSWGRAHAVPELLDGYRGPRVRLHQHLQPVVQGSGEDLGRFRQRRIGQGESQQGEEKERQPENHAGIIKSREIRDSA